MNDLKQARNYFLMCAAALPLEDPKDSTDDYKCGIKFGNILIAEIDRLSLPVTDGVWDALEDLYSRVKNDNEAKHWWPDAQEKARAALATRVASPAAMPGEVREALPTLIGMGYQDLQREFGVNFVNASNLHGWIARTVRAIRRENLEAPRSLPTAGVGEAAPIPESQKAREWDEDEIKTAPDGWYAVRLHEDDYVDGMCVSENDWIEAMVKDEAIRATEFPSFVSAYGPIPAAPDSQKGGEYAR